MGSSLEINLVWAVLIFFSVYMVIFSFLIHLLEPITPKIVSDAFGYGKTTKPNLSLWVRRIQVPKSSFTHFYIFGVLLFGSLLIFTVKVVLWGYEVPAFLSDLLDFATFEGRVSNTSPEAILMVVTLMNLQCWRRLYECLYVNVDTGSKMNILHYIVGIAHYSCCFLGYISEAPGFAQHRQSSIVTWIHILPDLFKVSLVQWACVGLFFWAWRHQLKAHQIFADLKKKNSSHSVPYGDWFQFVSCPHYTAEILIYLSLAVICGWSHGTAWLIFAWVLINQIIAGLMSHWWYRDNFHNYPSSRRAVIPFLI